MTWPADNYERCCRAFILGKQDAERGTPSRADELENPHLRQSYLEGREIVERHVEVER